MQNKSVVLEVRPVVTLGKGSSDWKETREDFKDTGYAMSWLLAAQLCSVHENSWIIIICTCFCTYFTLQKKFSLKKKYPVYSALY